MIIAQAFENPSTKPIIDRLKNTFTASELELSLKQPVDVEWALREMITDTALISPIGYAESIADVQILGGACVSAYGATDDLNLYFKPGLHHLSTVACIDISPSDTVLAGIILREKYRMTPSMVHAKGSLEDAMRAADAVLVTTPREAAGYETVLDIVDEWWDMTQLPYLKFLIAGWKFRITEEFNERLIRIGTEADNEAIERMKIALHGSLTDDPAHQIPGHYRYLFDEDAVLGLSEYYRFAFFHGLHKDIPDISIWDPANLESSAPA